MADPTAGPMPPKFWETRLFNFLKNAAPYIFGWMLVTFCFIMEYTVMTGETLFLARKVQPSVSPEMQGRVLGVAEAGAGMFIAWLFQSTRSSGDQAKVISDTLASK